MQIYLCVCKAMAKTTTNKNENNFLHEPNQTKYDRRVNKRNRQNVQCTHEQHTAIWNKKHNAKKKPVFNRFFAARNVSSFV